LFDRVKTGQARPDGKRFASASLDDTLKIWDAQSGQEIRALKGHIDLVCSVAWSPDGKRLVSGCADGTLKVWDLEAWQAKANPRGQIGATAPR
jgi:WD40 repeat protein